MPPDINVNLIRIFDGPRHERLRFLWDCIAEYQRKRVNLQWYPNTTGLSHADCLERMWEAELHRPERYCLITEHDFLPHLGLWLPTGALTAEYPVLAARYVTRNPDTHRLESHEAVGPWYVLIDKDRVTKLHWGPWGEFNDPGNGLDHYLQQDYPGKAVCYLQHEDAMPRHYGVSLLVGEHLFWARHLHDHENLRIAGVTMGDMQRKHDEAVCDWARLAPLQYRLILRRRLKQTQAAVGNAEARAEAP